MREAIVIGRQWENVERRREGVEGHRKAIGSDKAKGQCGVKLEAGNGPWQPLNVIDRVH